MDIIKNKKARCQISIHRNSHESVVVFFAAQELRRYIARISGVRLAVTENSSEPLIELKLLSGTCPDPAFDGNDGYTITGLPNRIEIEGRTERGILYGVYALLEQFGCRWYGHEEQDQIIPRQADLAFNKRQASTPDFHIRSLGVHYTTDERRNQVIDWMGKTGFNWLEYHLEGNFQAMLAKTLPELRKRGIVPIISSHTMDNIFCMSDILEKRLDLAAEIEGVRGQCKPKNIQPPPMWNPLRCCDTHPEAIDLTAQKLIVFLRTYPEINVVGLTPRDGGGGWCDCINCRKIQPEIKSTNTTRLRARTDQYWYFAKHVVEKVWQERPDIQVILWAGYQYSDPPVNPDHLLPADKVWVLIDNYERCCTHDIDASFEQCWINGAKLAAHRKWLKLYPKRVYLWSEIAGRFDWNLGRIGACPGHTQIQKDCNVYAQYHLIGSDTNWETSLQAPNNLYFTSRVWWDLKLDAETLRQDFYEKYYGPAKSVIKDFFNELGEIPFGYTRHTRFRDEQPLIAMLGEHRIERLLEILAEAEDKARNREPYFSRVKELKERFDIVIAWIRLERASLNASEILNLLEERRNAEPCKGDDTYTEIFEFLKNYARPYYQKLKEAKDPAIRMFKKGEADFRTPELARLWKPFGPEPSLSGELAKDA